MSTVRGLAILSLFFVGTIGSVCAEEQADVHPYLTDKFTLDLGVFFPERELRIRVDSPTGGSNDDIDFRAELNDKRSGGIFSANFGWRFGEYWQLGAQYFDAGGSQETVLTNDVEWKDLVFGAGSSVSLGQDFTLTRIFFARDLSIEDQHEFGVGVGLHWLELGASISGRILDGNGNEAVFRTESVSGSAPLPNIGAWYVYSISPKWAFKTRVDWMSAKVGDYDGRLINAAIGVNYQVFEHAGVGLSYNLFDLDVGIRKKGWKGEWDIKYEGLYAYVIFFW